MTAATPTRHHRPAALGRAAVLAATIASAAVIMPAAVAGAHAAASAGTCPIIVAHRGLHSPYVSQPENSLAAADAAFREGGVHGIETDVKFSSDGVPMIMHDDTVDAMTNQTGKVSSYTAAQLASMRLVTTSGGSTLSSQYIPSLAQLLARVKADGGHLIAEVPGQDGHAPTAAEAQAVTQVLEQSGGWETFVTVASGAPGLQALQQADPNVTGHTELMVAYGTSPVLPDPVPGDQLEDADYSHLTQADVQGLHNAGEKAGAWIIDSAPGWSQFTGYGVDQITTDDAAGLVNWGRTGCTSTTPAPLTGYIGAYFGCVDDYGSSAANGNKIDLYGCNGTAAQQWTLNSLGELVNPRTGKCLNDKAWGRQGAKQILWDCNGAANERWTYSGGHYVSKANGLCLNDPGYSKANGTQLILWACGSYANERFTLP